MNIYNLTFANNTQTIPAMKKWIGGVALQPVASSRGTFPAVAYLSPKYGVRYTSFTRKESDQSAIGCRKACLHLIILGKVTWPKAESRN